LISLFAQGITLAASHLARGFEPGVSVRINRADAIVERLALIRLAGDAASSQDRCRQGCRIGTMALIRPGIPCRHQGFYFNSVLTPTFHGQLVNLA
jgi:hypothetical protein